MVDAARELTRPTERGRAVAVTAAGSSFGARLVASFEADPQVGRIVALGSEPPQTSRAKTRHYALELSLPGADARVAEILQAEAVELLIHLLPCDRPRVGTAGPQHLESLATAQLLAGARTHRLAHLVLWSRTWLYGAEARTPALLDEAEPLAADPREPYLAEQVAAERAVARFAREPAAPTVTILRASPLIDADLRTLVCDFLDQPVVVLPLGFDPPWQLLDARDAVAAIATVAARPVAGIFNVVGPMPLPLSQIVRRAGRTPVRLPLAAWSALARLLWPAGWTAWPPTFLPYLRYGCIADGTAAAEAFGFRAARSPEDALGAFARRRRRTSGLVPWVPATMRHH